MVRIQNSPLELRQLQAFLAVADEGHFGRAAERLNLTQPLLSMRIKGLETLVGHALFERRPRVALTAAGRAFAPYAARAAQDLEDGLAAASKAGSGVSGRLAIGYPSWVITSQAPETINRFRLAFPEVDVKLLSLRSADQIEQVRQRRLDIGFLRDTDPGPEFATSVIYSEPWLVAVPDDDPRGDQGSVSLRAFDGERLVLPDRMSMDIPGLLLGMLKAAGAAPGPIQETGSWLAALSLVAVGSGVALVPASQRSLWSRGIRYLDLEDPAPQSQVSAFWLASAPEPAVLAFLHMLQESGGQVA